MSEWPVVVARPLDAAQVDEMYGALEGARKRLDVLNGHPRSVTLHGLLTALAEGRICIEAEDEPTAEEVRDDLEHISDAHWEALKEGDL